MVVFPIKAQHLIEHLPKSAYRYKDYYSSRYKNRDQFRNQRNVTISNKFVTYALWYSDKGWDSDISCAPIFLLDQSVYLLNICFDS